MSYLLDTTACIAIINGQPRPVRERLRDAWHQGRRVGVSSIALFELWYGVAKSERWAANRERLSVFMAKLEGLPFDDRDAEVAGAIRARFERAGEPIGAYDTLMAGQALRRGITLVTANLAEFRSRAGAALGKLGGRMTPSRPPGGAGN
jgi:tRNA(fMet)-specific endonuclease VapC